MDRSGIKRHSLLALMLRAVSFLGPHAKPPELIKVTSMPEQSNEICISMSQSVTEAAGLNVCLTGAFIHFMGKYLITLDVDRMVGRNI